MLNTGLHIAVDEKRLKAIEEPLTKLLHMAEANNGFVKTPAIGDWIVEDEVCRLTKLGRTTLYKLRKENVLSCSSIVERKGRFYRLSVTKGHDDIRDEFSSYPTHSARRKRVREEFQIMLSDEGYDDAILIPDLIDEVMTHLWSISKDFFVSLSKQ